MGLFDMFKKQPAPPPAPPSGLLAELVERHGLEKGTPPPESSLMGEWWEQPPNDDLLLAFMKQGAHVVAFLGDPVEITEIYLVREAAGGFGLGATTDSAKLPAVRECLPRFSAAVEELHVYENYAGVSLRFAMGATAAQVEADLEVARAVLRAVEG